MRRRLLGGVDHDAATRATHCRARLFERQGGRVALLAHVEQNEMTDGTTHGTAEHFRDEFGSLAVRKMAAIAQIAGDQGP